MGSRMDKYKSIDNIPTRSDKNKELYKQVYNAYDEFENLIVPPNSREISPDEFKKEITSRSDYKNRKELDGLTNNRIIRKEKIQEEQKKENEVYDINELLNKAIEEQKQPDEIKDNNSSEDYLKKLKLDNRKTNIEQVKELYEDLQEDESLEDESLMKTANLSLEILSDLKGDSDKTLVSAPIKTEELPEKDSDFYSNNYKFSKKDFEGKDDYVSNDEDYEEEEEEEEDDNKSSNGKFFFKILLLIFGIALVVLVLIYFINYFNRV